MNDHESLEKDLMFIILIGGASSRFGTDKGLYEYKGKPLISYQIDVLSQFDKELFFVAKSNEQVHDYISKIPSLSKEQFILDNIRFRNEIKTHTPMLGFYSAFERLNSLQIEKAFVLSCDMPMIQHKVIRYLIEQSGNYDVCIPIWDNYFLEPLFAIYSVEKTLIHAEINLKKGKYKLLRLFTDDLNIKYISIEDEIKLLDPELLTFININTKRDLEKNFK